MGINLFCIMPARIGSIRRGALKIDYSPKNHEMCVHSEHTKHVALLLAQSKLKNEATAVLSCARRV